MSQICIYIELDPYLLQWFVHNSGGKTPVELERGSIESKILEVFLIKRPPNIKPILADDNKVAIYIPTFKYKPAEYYNHLTRRGEDALIASIRNRFDLALWKDLHHFGQIGKRQDELIYAWMEKNGIDMTETNWNAIAKRYQRQRELYLKRVNAKNAYNQKKSVRLSKP